MLFDKSFIKGALPHAEVLGDSVIQDICISVDTRTLQPGDFFVALKGAQVNGHQFVDAALEKGAAGCMIERASISVLKKISEARLSNKLIVIVEDTLQALGDLAKSWRAQFTYPVVGITGSVGKTSTKQMLSTILDDAGINYIATVGNQNSLIGLPISIFSMRHYHQMAVFEMGISKRGEMKRLAEIAKPTLACVTAVGHSHVEGLGSLQDIAAEKRDIFSCFTESNVGVVHGDQPLLGSVGYVHPVVKFGAKTTNQIQARKIRMGNDYVDFVLKLYQKKYTVRLPIAHEGMVFNALAAASCACLLGISDAIIVHALTHTQLISARFQQLPMIHGKGIIINDCYNANPESMKAAIAGLENIKIQATKIAVIGDMLELGIDAEAWHRQIGRFLRKAPSIKEVVLVGKHVVHAQELMPHGIKCVRFEKAELVIPYMQQRVLSEECAVLVKGSRGMHLEVIVHALAAEQGFSAAVRIAESAVVQSITPAKRPAKTV